MSDDEVLPGGYAQPELLLDLVRVELGGVRHLDCAGTVAGGHLQGVVAYHADRGELCRGGQRAIAGGGEQQIGFDLVVALEQGFLPGTGQGPEFPAALEDTSRFQFEATEIDQITVELQHFTWLHFLVAVGDHGQGFTRVRAVEHLGIIERRR